MSAVEFAHRVVICVVLMHSAKKTKKASLINQVDSQQNMTWNTKKKLQIFRFKHFSLIRVSQYGARCTWHEHMVDLQCTWTERWPGLRRGLGERFVVFVCRHFFHLNTKPSFCKWVIMQVAFMSKHSAIRCRLHSAPTLDWYRLHWWKQVNSVARQHLNTFCPETTHSLIKFSLPSSLHNLFCPELCLLVIYLALKHITVNLLQTHRR